MKPLLILIIATSLLAEPLPLETPLPNNQLPECPPQIIIKQESVLPDWLWFALGGLAGIGGVSFFYYNRK